MAIYGCAQKKLSVEPYGVEDLSVERQPFNLFIIPVLPVRTERLQIQPLSLARFPC
jgi:hypothetical protein